MDLVNEKYAVIPHTMKSDEEIQKNMAPEAITFLDRAKYLLLNGQVFQKVFVAKNITSCDPEAASQLVSIIATQIPNLQDEQLIKELIKAASQVFATIPLTKEVKQLYSDICFNMFSGQSYDVIDSCAEILKSLDDLETYKEGLYLETDNQMYQILKIIEIYYHKFTPELRKQAHVQIKSSMKHKDERIRRTISEILLNNQVLLQNILHDFDWIDKFTTLIYDPCKEVRKSSAKLFLSTYDLNEEIHKSRLHLLLENIIMQLDSGQFDLCHLVAKYSLRENSLQQLFVERMRQLTVDNYENAFLFLQSISDYYSDLKKFTEKYTAAVDDILILIVTRLQEDMRTYDILKPLNSLYSQLHQDTHFKILNALFLNFDPNQLSFIPYLYDIIEKATPLNKNKVWLQQLQAIYDLFKRSVFQYETKGLWFEIERIIDILQAISKLLFQQKDFLQLCLKMSVIGSARIRYRIMQLLIDSLINLDNQESREQIIQNYLTLITNSNYQQRQLVIEFCIRLCRQRSRKFFLTYNLINVLQLQFDNVALVRAKLPILMYEIKLLFWNDEKELLNRAQSILQNLASDKKVYIQQISKELQTKLQNIQFSNPQQTMEQNSIMDLREQQEYANLILIQKKPKKTEASKTRNQTPTARPPPSSKKMNQLLVPRSTQPRRASAQRAIQSKSPQPFK